MTAVRPDRATWCRMTLVAQSCLCLALLSPITIAATAADNSCPDLTQHKSWSLVSAAGCGRGSTGTSPTSRIYNGEQADLGEYPWLARIMFKAANGTVFGACGGSIINNRYVMTAAHCCLANSTIGHVTVGEHDTETEVDCEAGSCAPAAVNVTVESFVSHPGFDRKQPSHDICLIRLAQPLVFTDFVRPACLPFDCGVQDDDLYGTKMEIAGFGLMANTTTSLKSAAVLQKAEQEVVPLEICRRMWKGVFNISDAEICTLGRPMATQGCHGDSGGPLMALPSPEKEPVVVGIISHGWTCFLSVYYGAVPSVNVRVSAYLTWILDNIRA